MKKTKIVLMSDSHSKHNGIYILKQGEKFDDEYVKEYIISGVYLPAEADVIICSGDISMSGSENEIDNFLAWYSKLPYTHKILVPGNHDRLFEQKRSIAQELLKKYPNIIYLESQGVTIDGIKFYGEPVQPTFGYNWAFNVDRGEKIKRYWDAIPDDVEFLILHGPPYSILDSTIRGEQVGCKDLLKRIYELKNLKLVSFGHIHEHAGYKFIDGVHFVNASVLNLRYEIQNKPMIFEIDENKNITRIE